jgi:acetyl esterase/lipase
MAPIIAARTAPNLRPPSQICARPLDAMSSRYEKGCIARVWTLMHPSSPADKATMQRSSSCQPALALAALIACAALLALLAPPADAALNFLTPKPKPVPVLAPVQPPLSADPATPARGTMIMVHAGGWRGHDGHAQDILFKSPGDIFLARGWRIVSIDYNEGPAGLQDVLDAVGAELARRSTDGPVCLYGESSGAHLAIMAAARQRAVDCVMGLGTPTDLLLYENEAATSTDSRVILVAAQIARFFGTTPETTAPWNLVALAPYIHADVMLVHEEDDELVSGDHAAFFQAARPTMQRIELEPGPEKFLHGTVSEAGRARYMAALGAFLDRAISSHNAERAASATGCAKVTRSVLQAGLESMMSGLRCLARKDPEVQKVDAGWSHTSVKLRGEVNAARIWAYLRGSQSGRGALAAAAKRRAKIIVRTGDRSRVILKALKTRR